MYPAPNPAEAVRQTAQQLRDALASSPRPEPSTKVDFYSSGWDGLHCAFIYTHETLLDFPVVPTFTEGHSA